MSSRVIEKKTRKFFWIMLGLIGSLLAAAAIYALVEPYFLAYGIWGFVLMLIVGIVMLVIVEFRGSLRRRRRSPKPRSQKRRS